MERQSAIPAQTYQPLSKAFAIQMLWKKSASGRPPESINFVNERPLRATSGHFPHIRSRPLASTPLTNTQMPPAGQPTRLACRKQVRQLRPDTGTHRMSEFRIRCNHEAEHVAVALLAISVTANTVAASTIIGSAVTLCLQEWASRADPSLAGYRYAASIS